MRPKILSSLGISDYRFVNYEGTKRKDGPNTRSSEGRGGFAVELINSQKQALAFVWMRGSGTEQVFRLMADIPGENPEDEITLIEWHRTMLDTAIRTVY